MIVEYIRYKIDPRGNGFRAAGRSTHWSARSGGLSLRRTRYSFGACLGGWPRCSKSRDTVGFSRNRVRSSNDSFLSHIGG
jgi:hypothetical protein